MFSCTANFYSTTLGNDESVPMQIGGLTNPIATGQQLTDHYGKTQMKNELDDDSDPGNEPGLNEERHNPSYMRSVYIESLVGGPGVSEANKTLLNTTNVDDRFNQLIQRFTDYAFPTIRDYGPIMVQELSEHTIRCTLATHLL